MCDICDGEVPTIVNKRKNIGVALCTKCIPLSTSGTPLEYVQCQEHNKPIEIKEMYIAPEPPEGTDLQKLVPHRQDEPCNCYELFTHANKSGEIIECCSKFINTQVQLTKCDCYVCMGMGVDRCVKDYSSYVNRSEKMDGQVKLNGNKNDNGKPELGLVPKSLIWAVGTILTFGAKIYGTHNWRKGLLWSRPYNALFRHLTAWWNGESLDLESGKSHLWHAATELAFLIEYEETKTGQDDRFKIVEIDKENRK